MTLGAANADHPGGGPAGKGWRIGRRELIAAPRERVWRALTEPAEIASWLADRAEVDLRPGGKFAFTGRTVPPPPAGAGTAEDAGGRGGDFEVLELQPPERLSFRWRLGDVETTVSFDLRSHLEQTDLTVVQEASRDPGWPSDPGVPSWWSVSLPALRARIEEGRALLRLDYCALDATRPLRFRIPVSTFPWVIWHKLTTPEELGRWWGRDIRLEGRAGGAFRIYLSSPALLPSPCGPERILEWLPNNRLVHDWKWPDGSVGRVEWTIEETDDDTILGLTDHGPRDASTNRVKLGVFWASSLLALQELCVRGVAPREHRLQ